MTKLTQITLFEKKHNGKKTDKIQYNYQHESFEIDPITPTESTPNLPINISKIKTISNETITKCIYEKEKYYIIKKLLCGGENDSN